VKSVTKYTEISTKLQDYVDFSAPGDNRLRQHSGRKATETGKA
jgi:hypothetical protein